MKHLLDMATLHDGAGAPPWRVYVTGHSLGGARASICAFELAKTST